MEKEENKKSLSISPQKKWFTGYLVAGLIWVFAQSFKKSDLDELIILFIAIMAGVFYYRLKSRITLKNEAAKIIITFIILEIIAGGLVGFLTSIGNSL